MHERGSQGAEESDGARRTTLVWLTLITLGATVLRLLAVDRLTFVGDEFGTLHWITAPVGEIMSTYETQVTMHSYILFLKYWALCFGDSPLALKLPSIVAGIATVPVTYLVGRRFVGRDASLLAALLTAISILLITYSQQARSYAFLLPVQLASMALYWRCLHHPDRRTAGLLVLTLVLAFTLSLNAVFLFAVQACHATLWCLGAVRERRRSFLWMTSTMTLAAGLSLLFYAGMFDGIQVVSERWTGDGSIRFDWIRATIARLHRTLRYGTLAFMVLGTVVAIRRDRWQGLLLVLWAVLPWLLHVYNLKYPIATYRRYLLPTLPAHFYLAGLGIMSVSTYLLRERLRGLRILVPALVLCGTEMLSANYFDYIGKGRGPPYEAAYAYVDQVAKPRDLLLFPPLGTDRPELLEMPETFPEALEVRDALDGRREDAKGRVFILCDPSAGGDLDYWTQHFEAHVVDPEATIFDLTVLRGERGTGGGKKLVEAVQLFLLGYLQRPDPRYDGYEVRHLNKAAELYALLARTEALLDHPIEEAEYDNWAREYRLRSREAVRGER